MAARADGTERTLEEEFQCGREHFPDSKQTKKPGKFWHGQDIWDPKKAAASPAGHKSRLNAYFRWLIKTPKMTVLMSQREATSPRTKLPVRSPRPCRPEWPLWATTGEFTRSSRFPFVSSTKIGSNYFTSRPQESHSPLPNILCKGGPDQQSRRWVRWHLRLCARPGTVPEMSTFITSSSCKQMKAWALSGNQQRGGTDTEIAKLHTAPFEGNHVKNTRSKDVGY